MAKSLNVTWLGDADPHMQIITEAGVEFIKGRPVKVPADHQFGGIDWAPMFKGNPMFSVDEDADEVDADEVDAGEAAEIEATKQLLDEKGVKYRANASLDSLRKLLDDA